MTRASAGRIAAILFASLTLWNGCASAKPPATASPATSAPEITPQEAAAKPSAPLEGQGWKNLFNRRDLTGWQITDFAGHGPVQVQSGLVVAEIGDEMGGINWTNEIPKTNYEIALDAMKLEGSDFFCGLTFPVGDSFCSLILGGWGGTVMGLSSIDGQDASENETTGFKRFEVGKWYRVRVRVTDTKIEAWLDGEKIADVTTTGKKIGLRFGEIENSKPLGLAAYQTRAAFREIQLRRLDEAKAQK